MSATGHPYPRLPLQDLALAPASFKAYQRQLTIFLRSARLSLQLFLTLPSRETDHLRSASTDRIFDVSPSHLRRLMQNACRSIGLNLGPLPTSLTRYDMGRHSRLPSYAVDRTRAVSWPLEVDGIVAAVHSGRQSHVGEASPTGPTAAESAGSGAQ
jgi:hypothetical protein